MMKTHEKWQSAKFDDQVDLPTSVANYDKNLKKFLYQYHYQHPSESLTTYLAANVKHNAADLNDIDKAWARLKQAKAKHEKVCVYGDYDVDGITSTTIMYEGLKAFGLQVDYVIPNRLKDGYGPSKRLYQQMLDDGVDLVVTVDNGVSGRQVIDEYHQLGLDVIVTDHHEPNEPNIPETAAALVHPMLSPDYHFTGLSGAGVAYKFITYQLPDLQNQLIDLAAMGIIADVMPLVDENRRIVKAGLHQLAQTKRLGLESLKKAGNVKDNNITATTVGFMLGPMLNSMGRLLDARPAIEALVSHDEQLVQKDVALIEKTNAHRKDLSGELEDVAFKQGEKQNQHHDILLVGGNHVQWPQGIVGIIASRVVDRYHKPVLALSFDPKTQEVHGSARSVDGYSIFDALNYVNTQMGNPVFLSMGGHAGAAGFGFKYAQMAELQRRLDYYTQHNPLPKFDPKLTISASLTIPEANDFTFYDNLQMFAPFGQDNPEPLYHVRFKYVDKIFTMGAKKQHVKVVGSDDDGHTLTAIGFNMGNDVDDLYAVQHAHESLDVVGTLSKNEFRNHTTMQLLVSDWGQL